MNSEQRRLEKEQLQGIFSEVAEWSTRNFGHQISKHTGAEMGSDAPLYGLVEEIGEYAEGTLYFDEEKIEDSLADMMVFLSDFITRSRSEENYDYSDINMLGREVFLTEMLANVGKLFHLHLKRHQGIRKLSDIEFFRQKSGALNVIWSWLRDECERRVGKDYLDVLSEIWDKVKQRDWTKNSQNGSVN